jgi:histidinol-phosphatase (PHP family)
MLLDYHMHTRLTDGVGEPRDYARVALARGLAEIGCSDHAPLRDRETDWTMKKADLPAYVELVRVAQREYAGRLPVKLGLEVDYVPGHEDWVRELAALHPWDFLLGSVHYLGDWPVDRSAEDWRGQDVIERWRQYFDLWAQAARSGLFDSLAHPDLPKKFGFRPVAFDYRPALTAVVEAGCAIEISTAGLRKPCREIYPALEFLRTARQFDIPVTFGSDAHLPDDCGLEFAQATAWARQCGYDKLCRFTQRRRELVPL